MANLFDLDKMIKELISVQPIHKDEKVIEAMNFLLTNKDWSITPVNPSCPNVKALGKKKK